MAANVSNVDGLSAFILRNLDSIKALKGEREIVEDNKSIYERPSRSAEGLTIALEDSNSSGGKNILVFSIIADDRILAKLYINVNKRQCMYSISPGNPGAESVSGTLSDEATNALITAITTAGGRRKTRRSRKSRKTTRRMNKHRK
jgi:hypothetical protein